MIYLSHNSKADTLFELMVSSCIILVLVGTFGISAHKVLGAAREVALKNELANLRLSLELYRIFNHKNPEKLEELCSIRDYFVLVDRFDKEKRLLDPFGNRYSYNPKTGKIYSITQRYRNW